MLSELSGEGPITDVVFGGPVTFSLCVLCAFLAKVRTKQVQVVKLQSVCCF